MTITLPWTPQDRDRIGHALHDGLIKLDIPNDIACQCVAVVRGTRDLALAFDEIRRLTRDADISFAWEVSK